MDRKEMLKNLIKELHHGVHIEEIKAKFKEIIKDVDSKEIAEIEGILIQEGMPREEIQKLCDVHMVLFKESLEKGKISSPPGHPIYILMQEHEQMLKLADELKCIAGTITDKIEQFAKIVTDFKGSENHYLREENVFFPYLEKHGITEPPAVMWMEHDKIRAAKKELDKLADQMMVQPTKKITPALVAVSSTIFDLLNSHFYKENNILFPTGLKVISEKEWSEIRQQFDEIGYCDFTPPSATVPFSRGSEIAFKTEGENMINFETGSFSQDELDSLLNSLPVDLTFVDKDDTVRYFSQTKNRIFPRTKAVIGRKVQQCHPQKSLHVVNQILDDFRNNRRSVAEFWINMQGRIVYIRYFAVRNAKGEYLGCLEVTQDITEIQKIKGEKRLL